MYTLLTAIFGFLAPFLPAVLDYYKSRMEAKSKLDLAKVTAESNSHEALLQMQKLAAEMRIEEIKAIYQQQPSLSIQLLTDKVVDNTTPWLYVPGFYALLFIDFLTGLARPLITYCAFGFYMVYKFALFQVLTTTVYLDSNADALLALWKEDDFQFVALVLSYYFGQREFKRRYNNDGKQ